jgi:hypothetical protein
LHTRSHTCPPRQTPVDHNARADDPVADAARDDSTRQVAPDLA